MTFRVASGIMTCPEVRRLLASAQSVPRDRLLLRMLYFTGLRRAEMVSVLVADVLWDLGAIFVRSGKEDKDRYVFLDPTTMELLRDYVAGVALERPIFDHTDKWVHDVFLIHGTRSGLIQEYKAKGLRLSPHSMRYAFATHFHDQGLPLATIASLLGHVLPQDTVDYLHTSRARLEEAYEICNPYASGAPARGQAAPSQIPSKAMVAEAFREREKEFRNQPQAGRSNGLPMFATPEEMRELLAESRPPYSDLLRTLYASGLWIEDVLRAKVRHLNCELREIRLGQQVAFLDRETCERLGHRDGEAPLFSVALEDAQDHLLECGRKTGLSERLQAAQSPLTLDRLRQAFAIHSAARGMDTITLMNLLGHQFYTTTQPYLQAAVYRHRGAFLRAVPADLAR